MDTTRADRLGAYGFALAQTPTIDTLAREGVRCADATAVAPITLPSHSSIMSGLFPDAHGVHDNGAHALSDEVSTLAEHLKSAGYDTSAFVSAAVLDKRYNLNQGFDVYNDNLWAENEPATFMIRNRPARRTAGLFLNWLEQRTSSQKPFFTWLHFFDPHQPYEPTPEKSIYAPTRYDAEIAAVDGALATIVQALRAQRVLDNTLIVVTADHGESLGEHGEKTHAIFIYDATVHVPLVWWGPKHFPQGTVYSGPVRSVDIMPTILSAVGVSADRRIQGQDLLAALRGEQAPPELPQYTESLLSEVGFGMAPLRGVRLGGYKLIRAPQPELYDLREDPRELNNIYAEHPDVVHKLDVALQDIMDESARRSTHAPTTPMDRETQEMLAALGYVGSPEARQDVAGMDPKVGVHYYAELEEARHAGQRGHWDKAAQRLVSIVADLPNNVSARSVRALAFLHLGQIDSAEHEYETILTIDPNQYRIHSMLGRIALDRGDLVTANSRFQSALAQTPGFVEGMGYLGEIAMLRGDTSEAETWFRKASDVDAHFPRFFITLGDRRFLKDDFAAAATYYERSLEFLPNHFKATVQAGLSRLRVQNYQRARQHFALAEVLRPDSWLGSYNSACASALLGETQEALVSLQKTVANGFTDPQLLDTDADLASVRHLPEFQTLRLLAYDAKKPAKRAAR